MKILVVSAELRPYAYTGGLGDVMAELPEAMARLGHEVKIVIPGYLSIPEKAKEIANFEFDFANEKTDCMIAKYKKAKSKVENLFVMSNKYFARDNMYMYSNDGERFAYFDKAVLEMLKHIDFIPDYILCNDWHTGLITFMLKEQYRFIKEYSKIRSIFVIHNIEYQGLFPKDHLRFINADESYFVADKLEYYGQINYLKTGIVYADKVFTVSPTYSKEISRYEYGFGLDGVIRSLNNEVIGILNGIEYDGLDKFDKKASKEQLCKKMKFKHKDWPILGMVTRIADQKGIEILIKNMEALSAKDVNIAVIGIGKEYYTTKLAEYANRYPDKITYVNKFDVKIAELIFQGSDIFLMPSLFEPCGLGQMRAMKYGTIPIARRTGGLNDTIKDIDENKNGNGFLFNNYSEEEFLDRIEHAIGAFANKRKWNKIMSNAMKERFTWDESSKIYEKELKKVK